MGIVTFLAGFWLQFHTLDFFAPGNTAPFAHVFRDLADLLMYAGVALAVLAATIWMYQGIRRPTPSRHPEP